MLKLRLIFIEFRNNMSLHLRRTNKGSTMLIRQKYDIWVTEFVVQYLTKLQFNQPVARRV